MITRFAPSPTGLLHLGHAFSALTAWDAARAAGGHLVLRIEDIDEGRCRPAFETAILDDLAWLGVAWETPVRRQSEHLGDYRAALEVLAGRGLAYRCFKTRKDVQDAIASAPHHSEGGPEGSIYFGARLPRDEEATRQDAGEAFTWRLDARAALGQTGPLFWREDTAAGMQAFAVDASLIGDVVIARKDGGTSYHLASVHDDAHAGITHVIRGQDLRGAAPLHRLLQALFGWPAPVYRHHRLILGPDGKRLAKRDAAQTLQSLRAQGQTPSSLRTHLGLPLALNEQ